MDKFFTILKKSLVATVFVIFALVGTYIPQDWNKVEVAHAGGAVSGGYTIPQGVLALVEQAGTAINTLATSIATEYLVLKDGALDGIMWVIAKQILSQMMQSLISWINSGFQGSPAFVQDLQGFLLNAADSAIGDYLGEITGAGSFLCSPFRLDISIAIAQQYQRTRVNQPTKTCTLTGIIDNIEGFTSGAAGSFSQGGWDDWFDITSSPEVYTPYGAYLAAEAGAQAAIVNAKGEKLSILNFGDGFLSGEICQAVSGSTKQDCFISKPGKVIQEALSFNIDSERQSLVAADEVDEVVAALFGQLANKVLTGAAGLLGIGGGGSGYTGQSGSFSYTPSVTSSNSPLFLSTMQNTRTTLKDYNTLATSWRPILLAYAADTNNPVAKRNDASIAAAEAGSIMSTTANQIIAMNQWIADYSDPKASAATKAQIFNDYNAQVPYWSEADISSSLADWQSIVN